MPSHRARSMTGPLVVLAVVAVLGGSAYAWTARDGDGDAAREPVASDGPTTTSTTETTPSTPEPTPTPTVRVPRPGDCRELAFDDTDAPLTEAAAESVPCGRPHTAQTIATGRLPGDVDPAADPGAVSDAVSAECRSAMVGWLGADEAAYELSMFAYVVGVPPESERAAGADWYRCDTYVIVEEGQLAELPRTTEAALASEDEAADWAACVDGDLGTDSAQVLCRQPHDWRGVSAFRLGDRQDPYPGLAEVADQTETVCADDVAAFVDDPLATFDYGWLRPSEADWERGQRFAVCFAETPS